MDRQHRSPDDRAIRQQALRDALDQDDELAHQVTRERFDLEPEPAPQPTVQDVLEGIAAALEQTCELATPQLTAARTLTITTRMQAAANGHVTADELLASLRRLVREWAS